VQIITTFIFCCPGLKTGYRVKGAGSRVKGKRISEKKQYAMILPQDFSFVI
jgi:hypothetical protein